MKNIITLYELIGLIKDGQAPKKIIYDDEIFDYVGKFINYQDQKGDLLFGDYIYSNYLTSGVLNNLVEILPEENDEWENIELLMCLDTRETSDCICKIQDKINSLIKNQKYLKEKLESKDEKMGN